MWNQERQSWPSTSKSYHINRTIAFDKMHPPVVSIYVRTKKSTKPRHLSPREFLGTKSEDWSITFFEKESPKAEMSLVNSISPGSPPRMIIKRRQKPIRLAKFWLSCHGKLANYQCLICLFQVSYGYPYFCSFCHDHSFSQESLVSRIMCVLSRHGR